MLKLVVHTGMQVDGIEPRLVKAAQKVRVGAVCGHGIGYFKLHFGERNHSGLAEDESQVTSHCLMMSPPWNNMSKYQLWCEQIHRLSGQKATLT
jgi:hypothetical protein